MADPNQFQDEVRNFILQFNQHLQQMEEFNERRFHQRERKIDNYMLEITKLLQGMGKETNPDMTVGKNNLDAWEAERGLPRQPTPSYRSQQLHQDVVHVQQTNAYQVFDEIPQQQPQVDVFGQQKHAHQMLPKIPQQQPQVADYAQQKHAHQMLDKIPQQHQLVAHQQLPSPLQPVSHHQQEQPLSQHLQPIQKRQCQAAKQQRPVPVQPQQTKAHEVFDEIIRWKFSPNNSDMQPICRPSVCDKFSIRISILMGWDVH